MSFAVPWPFFSDRTKNPASGRVFWYDTICVAVMMGLAPAAGPPMASTPEPSSASYTNAPTRATPSASCVTFRPSK